MKRRKSRIKSERYILSLLFSPITVFGIIFNISRVNRGRRKHDRILFKYGAIGLSLSIFFTSATILYSVSYINTTSEQKVESNVGVETTTEDDNSDTGQSSEISTQGVGITEFNPVTDDEFEITATNYRDNFTTSYLDAPPTGYKYIAVDITISNIKCDKEVLSNMNFFYVIVNNKIYGGYTPDESIDSNNLTYRVLKHGERESGYLYFIVPTDAKVDKVYYSSFVLKKEVLIQ